MIVYTASSTGGHLYPAIALAQATDEKAHFIIENKEMSEDIIRKYGFPYSTIKRPTKNPVRMWILFRQVKNWLKLHDVSEVIATGGYLTVPVILAAKWRGIRITLYEQNVLPGRVNRAMARFADKVVLAFEKSKDYITHANIEVSGNPIRQHYADDDFTEILQNTQFPEGCKTVGVIGGSQGAVALNEWVSANTQDFLDNNLNLIHITGPGNTSPQLSTHQSPITISTPYCERMDLFYEKCDFIIARAGATTIAELLHYNKPAILVPYPFAKDNHQEINAREMEKMGNYKCVKQEKLSFNLIPQHLNSL